MSKLKDKIWIWGHPTNCLKGHHGLTKDSNISPIQGMNELNARNVFYIPNGPGSWDLKKEQSIIKRNELSAEMQEQCNSFAFAVRWDDTVQDFIDLKNKYSRLKIAIFDDFFQADNDTNNVKIHSIEKIINMKKRLNDIGMELWVVYYERDIGWDISPYLQCFDGFSFWFWNQPTPEQYDKTIKIFIENTPNKKRFVGCYMYDFGREHSCNPDNMEIELEKDYNFIKEGKINGIILHTNAVGGMNFEGYDRAKEWMNKHGEEEI